MARIDALPSLEIIRGLKGILDFYVWRGLPCVRAWPKYRPARRTAASLAAALTFGAIVKAYSLLANLALEAYREDALDQPRTARDIMVTGAYGNLHEASMSDFLDLLVECRDFLSDLTALLDALHSIDTDEIVTRVEHSVLPDGAATFARQTSILTRVTEIADLQDALESKALDRLLVRGMDQLFSFNTPLRNSRTAIISGANGFVDSNHVPANKVWMLTHIVTTDFTSPTTTHLLEIRHTGVTSRLSEESKALAAADRIYTPCRISLDTDAYIRCYFSGGQVGDSCRTLLHGYIMTKET